MSSSEWFDGKEGLPPKIDLASIYAGEEPAEIPSESKPSTKVSSFTKPASPTKKEAEPAKEPSQTSSTLRGPPPSMKEQTTSIAHLASKFTDEDELESDEDNSSFEEVPKPTERSERNLPRAREPVEPATLPRGLIPQPIESKPDGITQAPTFSALSSQPAQTQPKVFLSCLSFLPFYFAFVGLTTLLAPTDPNNDSTAINKNNNTITNRKHHRHHQTLLFYIACYFNSN